jgi:hypothetical protein
MSTFTWTGALHTAQTITADHTAWLLADGASIDVASGAAITDNSAISGESLEIAGSVTANVSSATAISLSGKAYAITVDLQSEISAYRGFTLSGAGSTLTNNGSISGAFDGIFESGGNNKIVNNASISGGYGIELLGIGTTLDNGVHGVIDGTSLPVWFGNSTGKTSFINHGIVNGDSFQSIGADAGRTTVTNYGTINHAIYLGDGNDTFINKGGKALGVVDLEHGSDLYVIDRAGIAVSESDAGNTGDVDTVKASVSYVLGDEIENLVLTGTKALKGAGNGLANSLTGNSGNNILAGKGGNDLFVFTKGAGQDTIADFTDKHDHIDLSHYKGIDAWADIRHDLTSHSGDVVLNLGHGDTITIADIGLGKITGADFVF